ncbi:MAG: PTS sugar transporter subunit IIC [Deltaproteobacteria bacterium]|nr:PTS sugar transporter subunit IIC [Candidatus Tharpella aukensis]
MWLDLIPFVWLTAKISLLGAVLALDRTALFQGMLSRPLIAATFAGALAGNWEIGLLLGASLELYFLCEMPVGSNIPTDDTLLALAAGGCAAALSGLPANVNLDDKSLALMVLLTILPWAAFTRKLDGWVRDRNAWLIDEMETRLLAGENSSAINFHLYGVLNFYGAAAGALALIMISSLLLVPLLLLLLPVWAWPLTDRLLLVFPAVGIAGLLCKMNQKRQLAVFVGISMLLLVF